MRWKKELGYLREVGPDIPSFRAAVKFLWEHIARLEAEIDSLRVTLLELKEEDEGE